jgi:hypothetical protein
VNDEKKHISFPLRLAVSLKERAQLLARQDGVSLNHFISLAVAEKISRLRAQNPYAANGSHQESPKTLATRVRCEVKRDFTAYTVIGLQPITIPAGHSVFAILNPVTGQTDEIEFTWGRVGDIWYRASRDLFLSSARQ